MRAQFNIPESEIKEEAPHEEPKQRMEPAVKPKKNPLVTALIVLLVLALLGGIGYVTKLYLDAQHQLNQLQDASASKVTNLTDDEVKMLIARVAKHVILPDEKPQIVTITNVDQLKIDQPFFRVASNGDKLLVFTNRVVLYRPTTDQVVDIAQIRPAASESAAIQQQSTTASESAESTLKRISP